MAASVVQSSVVPAAELRNLKKHLPPPSTEQCHLDDVLQPLFDAVARCVPPRVNSNVLSVAGLLVNLVSSCFLVAVSPALSSSRQMPPWVNLTCGLGLMVSHALDGIHAVQTSRSRSNRVLHDLVAQGCNAWSSTLISTALGASLQLAEPYFSLLVLAQNACLYSHHWRAYVNGQLHIYGVREWRYAAIVVHLVTAVAGPSLWASSVLGWQLKELLAVLVILYPTLIVLNNFRHISEGGKGRHGSTIAETSILTPIVPFGLYAYAVYSFRTYSDMEGVSDRLAAYLLATGLLNAKITSKLIVAQLTKGRLILQDATQGALVLFYLNWKLGSHFSNRYLFAVCSCALAYSAGRHLVHACKDFQLVLGASLFASSKAHRT